MTAARCPSDLELERLLRRPAGLEEHLFGCPRCAARVAELRRLGDEFEREVLPATVEAVVFASAAPRRSGRALRWAVPALVAAAAALVVALRAGGPPGDYLGVKGPGLSLVVYAQGAEGARALLDGQAVGAGAGLRFEVRPGRSCDLFVASVDAAGQVSRIFPPAGPAGLSVKAGAALALPGGAVLDGRPGPERIFAVCGCGDEPITWADVARAAGAVGAGEARVRAARALPGLPGDALQATLLLEKRP